MAVRKKPGAKRSSKTAAKKARRNTPVKKASAKKGTRKAAARKSPAKKRTAAKKTPSKKAARKTGGTKKTASRKRAAAKRTATRKPVRKSAATKPVKRRVPAKTSPASRKSAAKSRTATALPPSVAVPPVPQRKLARKAARRTPPLRTAEPRSAVARKVGVRTAVQHETSRAAQGEIARKPGKTVPADLVRLKTPAIDRQDVLLTPKAREFLALLHRQFDGRRLSLLARRHERQARFDAGELPDFLHETRHVRSSGWRVTGLGAGLADGRDEVVLAPDPAAIAAAFEARAHRFVLDFEDAAPPTWRRVVSGHLALLDHWARASNGSQPQPELIVRPRGWHLPEAHVSLDSNSISASLFDVGLPLVHTIVRQIELGVTPRLCLPKLESYLEARLWSDVLTFAERHLGVPRGSCKVTVQIETLSAAFEMDEIVFELREHIAGLAFAPQGLVSSIVKRLGSHAAFLMPDRVEIDPDTGFLAAIADRLVKICHRRGIAALGPGIRHRALPALSTSMLDEGRPARDALIAAPKGRLTAAGLQTSITLAIRYLADWLEGGPAADPTRSAEAEIARALVWQWIRHGARLAEGTAITASLVSGLIEREAGSLGPHPQATAAARMFFDSVTGPDCEERLTLLAYRLLMERGL